MDAITPATPLTLPAGLPTEEVVPFWGDDTRPVTAVNICDLLPVIYPGWYELDLCFTVSYEERTAAVAAWCAAHGAHYYSCGREDFSKQQARLDAMALGLDRVVYEDLS